MVVRAFLCYLDEKGYTDDRALDVCMISCANIIPLGSHQEISALGATRTQDVVVLPLPLKMQQEQNQV